MLLTIITNLLLFLSIAAVLVIVVDAISVDAIDLWHMDNNRDN